MNEPRIVTSQEAQVWLRTGGDLGVMAGRLARTVATEPDRTRAAVVKALRDAADNADGSRNAALLHGRADAIENGADW